MRLKKLLIYVTIFLSVSLSGCILDSLNEVPLNIPQTYSFNTSGDAVNLSDDGAFCLPDNELYQDYQKKIKDIELLEITFRPSEVNPASLKGNVTILIRKINSSGDILFTYTIPNITPAAYLTPNKPYVLPATAAELSALNDYLKANGECFYVAVTVDNITPTGTKTIKGQIDFVFKANTDLG